MEEQVKDDQWYLDLLDKALSSEKVKDLEGGSADRLKADLNSDDPETKKRAQDYCEELFAMVGLGVGGIIKGGTGNGIEVEEIDVEKSKHYEGIINTLVAVNNGKLEKNIMEHIKLILEKGIPDSEYVQVINSLYKDEDGDIYKIEKIINYIRQGLVFAVNPSRMVSVQTFCEEVFDKMGINYK